jgi:hypothetical protein
MVSTDTGPTVLGVFLLDRSCPCLGPQRRLWRGGCGCSKLSIYLGSTRCSADSALVGSTVNPRGPAVTTTLQANSSPIISPKKQNQDRSQARSLLRQGVEPCSTAIFQRMEGSLLRGGYTNRYTSEDGYWFLLGDSTRSALGRCDHLGLAGAAPTTVDKTGVSPSL